MSRFWLFTFIPLLFCCACFETQAINPGGITERAPLMSNDSIISNLIDGCPGVSYPPLDETPYVLPYRIGATYPTGLTNCSASFHSAGRNDNLAFDFDMPLGTKFTAIRGGTVEKVVENQASNGGDGAGNFLVINHGDDTYALYYHSPRNGILVEEGEVVTQGQKLGRIGRSGYAGYPHLHLIVTVGDYVWPYQGKAVSFGNTSPRHLVLKTFFLEGYKALAY